jgi:hypothetical protein
MKSWMKKVTLVLALLVAAFVGANLPIVEKAIAVTMPAVSEIWDSKGNYIGNVTGNQVAASFIGGAAATHVDTIFFVADRAYTVTAIKAVWGTAEATGDMDIQVERLQATEACTGGAGDNLLSAAIDASTNGGGGTANTVNTGTLVSTTVTTLAAGDRLCLNLTATPNEITNMVVTVGLDPQ